MLGARARIRGKAPYPAKAARWLRRAWQRASSGHADRRSSFHYNGEAPTPGRNFRWYRKAVFQDQLRRFGWTAVKRTTGRQVYETITERQCMLALQATNDALALNSQATGHLEPYLGPQCYPQVRDEARYRANEPKASGSADEPPTLPAAREQLCCWLQCDDCRRWRLVERKSFSAVDPAGFARAAGDTDDHAASVNWAEWFDKAPARFDAFRRRRELRVAVAAGERRVDEEEHEVAAVAGACRSTAGILNEDGAGALAVATGRSGPDGNDGGAPSSGSESRNTSDRGSGDELQRDRPDDDDDMSFHEVLRGLGSKGSYSD